MQRNQLPKSYEWRRPDGPSLGRTACLCCNLLRCPVRGPTATSATRSILKVHSSPSTRQAFRHVARALPRALTVMLSRPFNDFVEEKQEGANSYEDGQKRLQRVDCSLSLAFVERRSTSPCEERQARSAAIQAKLQASHRWDSDWAVCRDVQERQLAIDCPLCATNEARAFALSRLGVRIQVCDSGQLRFHRPCAPRHVTDRTSRPWRCSGSKEMANLHGYAMRRGAARKPQEQPKPKAKQKPTQLPQSRFVLALSCSSHSYPTQVRHERSSSSLPHSHPFLCWDHSIDGGIGSKQRDMRKGCVVVHGCSTVRRLSACAE